MMSYNKSPPGYFREWAESLNQSFTNPDLYQWQYL